MLLLYNLYLDLGVMIIVGDSTLSEAPNPNPHNWRQFSITNRTYFCGEILPLNRACSWHMAGPADRLITMMKTLGHWLIWGESPWSRDFELKFQYYIHFWTKTLEKGITSPSTSSYVLNSITAVLLQGWFGIKLSMKFDMPLKKETKPID